MTKILVTGASGFIGKHLVPKLESDQYEVISVDSSWGDISEPETWNKYPIADVVIHLAGKSFVPASWANPSSFIKCNLLGTTEALNYCKANNSSLIFLSSYLYGNPDSLPINEQAPVIATNPYALSKKLAEDTCLFFANSFSLNVTVLRPFNVYGTGQPSDFLIPSIISQIKNSNVIKIKDSEPKRDYVYIDDLISAIISSVKSVNGYQVFNIGSGVSYSVSELIHILQQINRTNLPVESANQRRKDEIMNTVADISLVKKILKWEPTTSLQEGLINILNSYK